MTTTKYNEIIDALENLSAEEIIDIWNTYCDENNYVEDYIHYNNAEEIELLYGGSPWDLLNALGDYSTNDDYFSIDGYGFLNSFNWLSEADCPYDIDALANWLVDNSQYWDELGIEEDDN